MGFERYVGMKVLNGIERSSTYGGLERHRPLNEVLDEMRTSRIAIKCRLMVVDLYDHVCELNSECASLKYDVENTQGELDKARAELKSLNDRTFWQKFKDLRRK